MHSSRRATRLPSAAVAILLVAHLLWVVALAGSPALHARLHPAADQSEHHDGEPSHGDHDCAVTLFLSGSCHCAPAATIAVAPSPLPGAYLLAGHLPRVVWEFRDRGVLEHAPPRRV